VRHRLDVGVDLGKGLEGVVDDDTLRVALAGWERPPHELCARHVPAKIKGLLPRPVRRRSAQGHARHFNGIDDAFQAFPEVNPYVKTVSHSFVYTAGGGGEQAAAPLKSVRKFDVRQGTVVGEYRVGPGEFVSGPSFVPRPDGRSEDDGYLLVTVLHAAQEGEAAPRTRLEVLDAMDLNKGPLCSIALEAYLPHSLYGCWAEGVVPAEDDYAKGALRTAIKEKDWGKFGGGMSLIGIASWRDY